MKNRNLKIMMLTMISAGILANTAAAAGNFKDYKVVYDTDKITAYTSDAADENAEYILEDSSTKYLKQSDLQGLDKDTLQMAVNEIYARHGRKFATKEIQKYFNGKTWYKGTVEPDRFGPTSLNQYENENIALLLRCMEQAATTRKPGSSTGSANSAGSVNSSASVTTMYASTDVNIRSAASIKGTIMGVVPRGGSVTVSGAAVNGWVPANYNGIRGYICEEYLSIQNDLAGKKEENSAVSQPNNSIADAGTSDNYNSVTGTIISEGNDIINIQTADGEVYKFMNHANVEYRPSVYEVGDVVIITYTGTKNNPTMVRMDLLSQAGTKMPEEKTVSGLISYRNGNLIEVIGEDGSIHKFDLSGVQEIPTVFDEGTQVIVFYTGDISNPQVTSMGKF